MDTNSFIETEERLLCYAAINDFFSAWGLQPAKKHLFQILRSAMDRKATKINPSNVLYYFKTLKTLIGAALRIQEKEYQIQKAVIEENESGVPDLTQYKDYFGWHREQSIWHFAPHALSRTEYFNPYLVFKKIERYGDEQEWNVLLGELQDFTFYRSSFAECGQVYNILVIYRLLLKLIEAAYLIDVRAVDEVDEEQREKMGGEGNEAL